jgi:putative transposase
VHSGLVYRGYALGADCINGCNDDGPVTSIGLPWLQHHKGKKGTDLFLEGSGKPASCQSARVIVPGMPHHIVQRGHNRDVVFVENADYEYYLSSLAEWKVELGLHVYGYCVMTNHVHLIVGADQNIGAIGQLMKRLAGRQTRWGNRLEGRTGSLWESRYKVSPIDTDHYLLACCRYVELNPAKAHMVARPEDYPWSSYPARIGVQRCSWLDTPSSVTALGKTNAERTRRYRDLVEQLGDARKEAEFIAAAVERNQLTGGSAFVEAVEKRIGVRVDFRSRGRPRRNQEQNHL